MGLVKLYGARDALEAHHLRGILEAEGIRATVMGESLSAARGDLPLTVETLPAVWVDEWDTERAMEVVREYLRAGEEARADPGPVIQWVCPGCQEEIDPQFDQCWNCGETRPGIE